MPEGTLKWFSDEKGYSFISPNGGGEDLFVHYTGIEGSGFETLEEGALVTFETSQGKKGLQAVNVTRSQQSALYWWKPECSTVALRNRDGTSGVR